MQIQESVNFRSSLSSSSIFFEVHFIFLILQWSSYAYCCPCIFQGQYICRMDFCPAIFKCFDFDFVYSNLHSVKLYRLFCPSIFHFQGKVGWQCKVSICDLVSIWLTTFELFCRLQLAVKIFGSVNVIGLVARACVPCASEVACLTLLWFDRKFLYLDFTPYSLYASCNRLKLMERLFAFRLLWEMDPQRKTWCSIVWF